jgi:predicted RNA-binding Zn-ribbon protein involved in translation (DUF1610 family)
MGTTAACANCGTPLPADQPAGHGYCEQCAATWQQGQAREEPGARGEQDAAAQCANCGTSLPADQPAGHHYCARCAAAWNRGKSRR